MAAAIRGPSRRSSAATTRWPATTVRTCCRWASCTSCRSRASSSNPVALLVKNWQINGIASWLSGTPFTIGGDNGLLQQQGGSQTINVTGRRRAGLRRGGTRRAVVRPVAVLSAGQRLGQHRPQPVPRTAELEPRCVAVPDDSVRPLPCGASRGVAERVQPPAVGQPGDRLHRSQLHAHPQLRKWRTGNLARAAHGAVGREVRLLVLSEGLRPSDSPTRALARRFAGALPPPLKLRRDLAVAPAARRRADRVARSQCSLASWNERQVYRWILVLFGPESRGGLWLPRLFLCSLPASRCPLPAARLPFSARVRARFSLTA